MRNIDITFVNTYVIEMSNRNVKNYIMTVLQNRIGNRRREDFYIFLIYFKIIFFRFLLSTEIRLFNVS